MIALRRRRRGEVAGWASLMFLPGSTTAAWHDMTAVGRRWRGARRRDHAQAGDDRLGNRRTGLERLETGNDDDNAPMRAVNRKLGYRPVPDMLTFRGPLAPESLRPRPGDGAYSRAVATIDLNGIRLRNRLVTSGPACSAMARSKRRLILYGLSPGSPSGCPWSGSAP